MRPERAGAEAKANVGDVISYAECGRTDAPLNNCHDANRRERMARSWRPAPV